ncbi:MAG: ABC transporter substrate-binding protein [Candidatus Eisenbacteria sp.]|nr:ABC transporter substrate-binding protein [Candidatus Eisenbacteria bacterium]
MTSQRRIVSLVPSLTETLFDLGAGSSLVAATDYCISPAEACRIPRVGGPRNPDLEGIVRLDPDLVIAGKEENCREHLKWIRDRLPLKVFDCRSLEDALALIEALGEIVGQRSSAREIVVRTTAVLQGLREGCEEQGPKRNVFYPLWTDPWMTISRRTFVASMIEEAGGLSIFCERAEPYPTIDLAEARRREPDVVLLPDEPHAFEQADRQQFRDFRAYGSGSVHCIPGRWAAWYGTRMDAGLRGLHQAIYQKCAPL